MAEVNIDDVEKEYDSDGGRILAVDGVNLGIKDGEFLTIVGPSGSGKSTLLRMIAGLEDISSGSISIGEERINDVPPQRRDVAMVFQNYALYPHMSVRKNMAYGLKLTTDLPADEIDARVEEAAEMMGIEELLDKKPGNLSGGQQQRVATGRAIVREPRVFLMDEPLSNLDAKLKVHMRTELQRIQQELDTTTIYVTHDQEEAMTMSDRIVILDGGEIQQVGTPEEVYGKPANKFVADFIGSPSMNFIDVDFQQDTLVGEDFEYHLSSRIAELLSERTQGETLTLGIRPENIHVGGDEENTITTQVDVVESVGSDKYLYLSKSGLEIRARMPANRSFNEGEQLDITFAESDLHLFDPETEVDLLREFEETDSAATTATSASSTGTL